MAPKVTLALKDQRGCRHLHKQVDTLAGSFQAPSVDTERVCRIGVGESFKMDPIPS